MASDERVPNVSPEVLTPTELRVAKLLSVGCSATDIAERIRDSPAAVERHCATIYQKVGVRDHTALVRWVIHYDVARW